MRSSSTSARARRGATTPSAARSPPPPSSAASRARGASVGRGCTSSAPCLLSVTFPPRSHCHGHIYFGPNRYPRAIARSGSNGDAFAAALPDAAAYALACLLGERDSPTESYAAYAGPAPLMLRVQGAEARFMDGGRYLEPTPPSRTVGDVIAWRLFRVGLALRLDSPPASRPAEARPAPPPPAPAAARRPAAPAKRKPAARKPAAAPAKRKSAGAAPGAEKKKRRR